MGMNTSRQIRSLAIACILLLVAPTMAAACPIPFRTIGPVKLNRVDVRKPVVRASTRAAWKLDTTWTSTTPELNQVVVARKGGRYQGVSFATQRALSIDATEPNERGWKFVDDEDDETPPCELVGQGEWQPPVVFVREGARVIRIAAAAQRNAGDRTGCVLGGDDAEWGCPTLTRTVVRLKRPIGKRVLVFDVFTADEAADDTDPT